MFSTTLPPNILFPIIEVQKILNWNKHGSKAEIMMDKSPAICQGIEQF